MKNIEICEKRASIKSVMKEEDKAAIEEIVDAML